MKNEKKDIPMKAFPANQDAMMDYLKGRMNDQELHEVESSLMNDPFASDALDGLYGRIDPTELDRVQTDLNNYIRKKIKNRGKKSGKLNFFPLWIILLATLLLLISIAGYIIVTSMNR